MTHSFETTGASVAPQVETQPDIPQIPGDSNFPVGYVAILGTDHDRISSVHTGLAEHGITGYSELSVPQATLDLYGTQGGRKAGEATVQAIAKYGGVPDRDKLDIGAITEYHVGLKVGLLMNEVVEKAAAVVVTDVPESEADLTGIEARIATAEGLGLPVHFHVDDATREGAAGAIPTLDYEQLAKTVAEYRPPKEPKGESRFGVIDWLRTRRSELRAARASRRDGDEGPKKRAQGETTFTSLVRESIRRRFGSRADRRDARNGEVLRG